MSARPVVRWDPQGTYPAGVHPWSGQPTLVEPAAKVLTPEENIPAEHVNWALYNMGKDGYDRFIANALQSFHCGDATGKALTAGSPGRFWAWGGIFFANGTDSKVMFSRGPAVAFANKVAASGQYCHATWDRGNGNLYVFYSVASAVGQHVITWGSVSASIAALANINVTKKGVGQHNSDMIVAGTEAAALKFYKLTGLSAWAALSNPASTTITDPQTLTAGQKNLDVGAASGPIAFVPRAAACSVDDYVYSPDCLSVLKGNKTGLSGYYVGMEYDVVRDVWVCAMLDNSANVVRIYTGPAGSLAVPASPGGPWTDTGYTFYGLRSSTEIAFCIYDSLYFLAFGTDAVDVSMAFPSGFDAPNATLVASLDGGSTWVSTSAALPARSGVTELQFVKMPDRIALMNDQGIAISGPLRA